MSLVRKTQRWNWLRSEKFIIDYTDFQPEASKQKILQFADLVQGGVVTFIEMRPLISFTGDPISNSNICFTSEHLGVAAEGTDEEILSVNTTVIIEPTTGHVRALKDRHQPIGPPTDQIAFRKDIATELYLILNIVGAGNINDLTAGQMVIWYTWMRNV